MKIKKSIFFIVPLTAVLAVIGFTLFKNFSLAQSCPSNTTVEERQATLVGEVTDDGGDPNLEVWFQYGRTTAYGLESPHGFRTGIGAFCATVSNLEPGTAYHYRAVAKNSAGTSFGEDKTFTTLSFPVKADIKANNSDIPVSLSYRDYVSISWTSENAAFCEASGDWSGSKSTSGGSERIQLNLVKTYTFTITCRDASGTQTDADSVEVVVNPKPPIVITKPAIVTL